MAEELGTKDVLEQVDTRLSTLEQDIRSLDAKVDARFERVNTRFDQESERVSARFDRIDARFDRVHHELTGLGDTLRSEMTTHGRWQIGIMLTLFLVVIASIWLNP